MSDQTPSTVISVTQQGLDELREELAELIQVKLPKIIERVSNAREQGDLSENADYQSAKDEQSIVQARIDEIEEILSKAKVVKNRKQTNTVAMGSKVTVTKMGKVKKKLTFTVVGEFESNPEEGKISSSSPVGLALLGKKKGEDIVVKAPAGELHYHIEEIQ